MIISPLEQFNICPLWAFTLIDMSNFEIIYAKFLVHAWSFVNGIMHIFDLTWDAAGISLTTTFFILLPLLSATKLLNFITTWAILVFYTTLTFIFICSILSGTLINDTYRGILSYFESFYSEPFILIPLTEPTSKSEIIPPLCDPFMVSLSNLYFMMMELILTIINFARECSLDFLFSLSTQDFSYLIFSLNSSSLWILFAVVLITFIFHTTLTHAFLVAKNSWQAALETIYSVILGVVNENAGPKLIRYFPLVFTIFMIILTCNLLGMIPYSFTVTSHLIVTLCAALAAFTGVNIIGIVKNRSHFLSLFFPPGAPMALAPLLVFIEFVSYVFRVLSLSIRLFANLMSGHTLLKILSGFTWAAVSFKGIYLIPIFIIFLVTGLELGIAMIQAYIFSVLLCIYLNDAVNLH